MRSSGTTAIPSDEGSADFSTDWKNLHKEDNGRRRSIQVLLEQTGSKGSYIEGERLVSNPAHTANATIFYTLKTTALKGLKK